MADIIGLDKVAADIRNLSRASSEAAREALRARDIELVEWPIVLANKAEAREALTALKKDDDPLSRAHLDEVQKELAEAINAFLAGLSRSERFLFMRRYWYADAAQTIADMTGSTAGSVTVRLYRIRKKLRRFLKKEGLAV